ncbi:hypothetical protein QJS83_16005 [Bdellovibrio sp. 22V]|uniref:hypothetical protein n=1 Tax=Bdellovibrio TaxID=958 RepID=UPI0025429C69|nr:hypothetical protein [Bdellovibrio sp. 22V]WII71968.1 hypothetical protein QJS83_16005 [Bdellovibrio sp. 22V]
MRIFLAFLFSLSLPVFAAVVVTETVGQAADQVVTSREVQIAMVIEHVLYPVKNGKKDLYEVRPGQGEFRSAATSVLLEAVVALEAENFNVASLSDEELAEAVSKIEKAVAGKAYWAQLEVSPAELKKFTSRKLVAKSFLKFKTNSMSSIITDQEAQAYYDKNRVKFGSTPFASFKDNIKNYLAQQQLEERIRAWFEVIKRKYKVRTFSAD